MIPHKKSVGAGLCHQFKPEINRHTNLSNPTSNLTTFHQSDREFDYR
jgi:hypothetical protein